MSASAFLRRLFGRANGEIHQQTQRLVSLCETLLSEHGEITGVALAREALACYQTLGEREREEFFDVLAKTFSPSPDAVGQAADAYRADPIPENLIRLQESAESLRPELFRRLNAAPGATAALVEMRRLILKGIAAHPQWKPFWYDEPEHQYGRHIRYYQQLQRLDVEGAWHKVAVPTLIVWGEYDWIMGRDESDRAAAIVRRAAPVTYLVRPGMNHHFFKYRDEGAAFAEKDGTFDAQAATQIAAWIRSQAPTTTTRP